MVGKEGEKRWWKFIRRVMYVKITKKGLKGAILRKKEGTRRELLNRELKKGKTKPPKKKEEKDLDLDYEVFLQ